MGRLRDIGCNRRVRLDRDWQVAAAPAGSRLEDVDALAWIPAQVPGTAASALRAAGAWSWDEQRPFDGEDFWWRVRIEGGAPISGPAVLGLDGLATLADVWLDRRHVLASDNMYLAHEIALTLDGTHELLIRCRALAPELAARRPRPRWRVPMIEHTQLRWFRTSLLGRTPGWSPPCPAVGPWRPVWLEQRRLEARDLRLDARVVDGAGVVEVSLDLGQDVDAATLVVVRGERREHARLSKQKGVWQGRATVQAPDLWWPHTHGEPALYALGIVATVDGNDVDIALGNTGFRTIGIDREGGDFQVSVNGVPVFCRGACWTPLDVVSLDATPEACDAAIAQARGAGMNMLRVGGTMVYESDAFHDAMDRHGMLLWQELMFANMDYPEDAAFQAGVVAEVEQQLSRWQARPSLALVCGNSEVEQQAAMSGAGRERWAPPLFHEVLARQVAARGIAYLPSSAHGGDFPHVADVGTSSYYGVGAYRRPLDDARRAEVRFASECLAFANIPEPDGLPGGPGLRVHQPQWKARSPRDLGAGWDFDDVRDHYMRELHGVDPAALRASDHARYLALGRATTGEVMARAFAEWRRGRSPTRGALVWFLRDLWPGAGWGLVDAHGVAKPCLHALRRVLSPVALTITDEGGNGLAVHVVNDRPTPLDARLRLVLYRDGEVVVGEGAIDVTVPAHAAIERPATSLFEGFLDLAFSYRFGPPQAQLVHASLLDGEAVLAEYSWFPVGYPPGIEHDVGLEASVDDVPGEGVEAIGQDMCVLTLSSRRFAQSVTIEIPGFQADDNGFHVMPGQCRSVLLRAVPERRPGTARGTVSALNASTHARFTIP
ncbi:glycosyl hydrolase 2 galactose-binding domain-containing protein [Luteimonas sp. RIT-PG2_3]